jgi:hypothetical protein
MAVLGSTLLDELEFPLTDREAKFYRKVLRMERERLLRGQRTAFSRSRHYAQCASASRLLRRVLSARLRREFSDGMRSACTNHQEDIRHETHRATADHSD